MKKSKGKRKKAAAVNQSSKKKQDSKKTNISKSESRREPDINKKTPKWFFLVLILIPIIFFAVLELSLDYFNYGYDTSQWVDTGNGNYMLNPDIAKRYFTNSNSLPKPSEDVFNQLKTKNTFRVFVMGGSSAAGYPYLPLGSFSRYIRKRLELTYPNTNIEVVNLAMTAVNTYTLLDLLPGVLNQKPDLIIIYAGHNEYYGALGVGSMESLGKSSFIIKLILYLNKFKTYQLVKNLTNQTMSLFTSGNTNQDAGTLMSRMVKNKEIKLNSEIYNDGVDQFSKNLNEILSEINRKNIPVIVGKLVSNLKDQKPFISVKTKNYNTANEVYLQAETQLQNNNFQKADSLFELAKDLDALRFRAPRKFNFMISELCKKFNVPTVELDKIFNDESPQGIVGNNLMVDHLHPNLEGYKLMGRSFYEVMKKFDYLPKYAEPQVPFEKQDSITRANFVFTAFDSVVAKDIVLLLKHDWPFVKQKENIPYKILFNPKNIVDTVAIEYIGKKISWVDAHLKIATELLRKDNVKGFLKYMNVLIYQYSGLKDIHTAINYFYYQKKINPADYTTKRLGLIALYNNEFDTAINYLTESYKSNKDDAQILYNLALAYTRKQNKKLASNYLIEYFKINPKFPDPENLRELLLQETSN